MEFVQIVEYESDRPEDVRALNAQWAARDRGAAGAPTRVTMVRDHDEPRRFRMIAEFASYDEAMSYSARPETGEFAQRMRELATGEPRFVDLDVVDRITTQRPA